MKLYMIELRTHIVVAAESCADACIMAQNNWRDIAKDDHSDTAPCRAEEITSATDVKHGWEGHCIPYGAENDQTIDDILKAG